MTTLAILFLLAVISGLIMRGMQMKNHYLSELKIQKTSWSAKYNIINVQCQEYKSMANTNKKLRLEKKALLKRIDLIENERDNLYASLAALETEKKSVRYKSLEKECKTLAKKVVSLNLDNTAIQMKLASYHKYAKKRESESFLPAKSAADRAVS